MYGDFSLSELSTGWVHFLTELSTACLECCWTITGFSWFLCRVTLLCLNFLMSEQILTKLSIDCFECFWTVTNFGMLGYFALSELSTGWMDSYWTVYWLSRMLLSQALADLYTGWFCSIRTVYHVIWLDMSQYWNLVFEFSK